MPIVLHVPIVGPAEVKDLTFVQMQKAVGGYIQSVPLKGGTDLFCNEDGMMLNLPPNPHGELPFHVRLPPGGAILGDFFIVRHDREGEQVNLTEADIDAWMLEVA